MRQRRRRRHHHHHRQQQRRNCTRRNSHSILVYFYSYYSILSSSVFSYYLKIKCWNETRRNASNFNGLCTLFTVRFLFFCSSVYVWVCVQFKKTENPFEFYIYIFSFWKIPWIRQKKKKKETQTHTMLLLVMYVNFYKWISEQFKCNKANRSNSVSMAIATSVYS